MSRSDGDRTAADTRRDVPRRRLAGTSLGVVAGSAARAGCAEDAPQDTWQPAGENAQKIQDLQWPVFAIAGIVGLIVVAAVGWCVVPLPRPWPADPQADPRQAGAGDRPDDPAGA